jgi:hypothetical protein
MGHISDLPADVLWLILRRAIYLDYTPPWLLNDIISGKNYRLSLGRASLERASLGRDENYVIYTVRRYAIVNRRWLRIIGSKMRRLRESSTSWKFVKGAWANFHP